MSLNTIVRIHNKGAYQYEEYIAGEAGIYPGMLLEVNTLNKVVKQNTASEDCERIFAMEDALQGKDVTDVYTSGTRVCCLIGKRGTVVNALLNSGTNYTIGTRLMANGDGTLASVATAASGVTAIPIAVIEDEACDLTVSGATDTLHPVRLL